MDIYITLMYIMIIVIVVLLTIFLYRVGAPETAVITAIAAIGFIAMFVYSNYNLSKQINTLQSLQSEQIVFIDEESEQIKYISNSGTVETILLGSSDYQFERNVNIEGFVIDFTNRKVVQGVDNTCISYNPEIKNETEVMNGLDTTIQ